MSHRFTDRRITPGPLIAFWALALTGAALLSTPRALGASSQPTPSASPVAKTHGKTVLLHQRVVHVTISNFSFQPASIVVSPGTRVVWTNSDNDVHTVSGVTGRWSSAGIDTNGTYARVFRKTGPSSYYCKIHPFMHGTVTVKL